MENQKNRMIAGAIAIVTLVILLLILFIAYQSLVVVPREILQKNITAQWNKEQKYESCIDDAYDIYSEAWDSQCRINGEKNDCSLKPFNYEIIEKRHEKRQDTCLQIFKK